MGIGVLELANTTAYCLDQPGRWIFRGEGGGLGVGG